MTEKEIERLIKMGWQLELDERIVKTIGRTSITVFRAPEFAFRSLCVTILNRQTDKEVGIVLGDWDWEDERGREYHVREILSYYNEIRNGVDKKPLVGTVPHVNCRCSLKE